MLANNRMGGFVCVQNTQEVPANFRVDLNFNVPRVFNFSQVENKVITFLKAAVTNNVNYCDDIKAKHDLYMKHGLKNSFYII